MYGNAISPSPLIGFYNSLLNAKSPREEIHAKILRNSSVVWISKKLIKHIISVFVEFPVRPGLFDSSLSQSHCIASSKTSRDYFMLSESRNGITPPNLPSV